MKTMKALLLITAGLMFSTLLSLSLSSCGGSESSSSVTEMYVYPAAQDLSNTGNIGNRTTTNALCATAYDNTYTTSFSCTQFISVFSYTGDPVGDFPSNYGISSTAEIYGALNLNTPLADDWASFTSTDGWNLTYGSAVSSVSSWTGTDENGDLGNNCSDGSIGTASSSSIIIGSSSQDLNQATTPCNTSSSYVFMCLCY